MKGLLCLLRNIRNKNDGINAFLSGFISGNINYNQISINLKSNSIYSKILSGFEEFI